MPVVAEKIRINYIFGISLGSPLYLAIVYFNGNQYCKVLVCKNDKATYFYTPRNEVVGGYTGFTMSVRL
jgi:hypothetical protein